MKEILLSSENVLLRGRTCMSGNILKLIMSASGCDFRFTGRRLVITAGCDKDCFTDGKTCNCPRIAVFVNGRPVLKRVITERSFTFTVIDSPDSVSADIRIIKLSEAAFSVLELHPLEADNEAEITPVQEKQLKIEFIGDSITCGYGVDDANLESDFSTCAENAMKSYAYLTAKALNADYSMFSASGYGIISGYTHDGTRNLPERIPPFYESLGFSYSSVDGNQKPHEIQWDFSRFVPDIVVINLGTNDDSFCKGSDELKKEFEDAYVSFLKTVRRNNPESELLCAFGIMETEMKPCIKAVCERFSKETGDRKIRFLELKTQDGSLGYSSKWHPSEDTHLLESEITADFIRKTYIK